MENEYMSAETMFSADGQTFSRPLSVSELNGFIKEIFDGLPPFRDIFVSGEISNFKNHRATGHFYFTLKDDKSALRAVMFRSYASKMRFCPDDGMKVTVHGRVSSFVRDGQYQIYCDSMEPTGVGSLYAAYEQLKKKLSDKGIFANEHKKSLPQYPETVGVLTSDTGAAVRDIINVLKRRWPVCKVLLYPCLVQGDGASEDLIRGLEYFNRTKSADVLILGRGGGSIEDLWAFNSEKLAYAIYGSEIPVISAVGHETDFTIADFAADMRAPTPSAAAEIAVPDISEILKIIRLAENRLLSAVTSALSLKRSELKRYGDSKALKDPAAYLDEKNMALAAAEEKLLRSISVLTEKKKSEFSSVVGLLNSLSPLAVLKRGYSAVYGEGGRIVKSSGDVSVGEKIEIVTGDGKIISSVLEC